MTFFTPRLSFTTSSVIASARVNYTLRTEGNRQKEEKGTKEQQKFLFLRYSDFSFLFLTYEEKRNLQLFASFSCYRYLFLSNHPEHFYVLVYCWINTFYIEKAQKNVSLLKNLQVSSEKLTIRKHFLDWIKFLSSDFPHTRMIPHIFMRLCNIFVSHISSLLINP